MSEKCITLSIKARVPSVYRITVDVIIRINDDDVDVDIRTPTCDGYVELDDFEYSGFSNFMYRTP